MGEQGKSTELLWARYRGEEAAIPMARTLDDLASIIDGRLKPGLQKLLGVTQQHPVEYAGYALATYRTPVEKLALFAMFGGQETIDALRGVGLQIDTLRPKDDFWIDFSDHFDRMRTPTHEGVWAQGLDDVTGLSGFEDSNFLLGPVVRGPQDYEVDQYNQHADTDFGSAAAVQVSGRLILQGLYEYEPTLREGWAISPPTLANYFIDTYNLNA